MQPRRILFLLYAIFFILASCVTVNIYFPAAEVQRAADKIVSEVRGDSTESEPLKDTEEKKGSDKESWLYRDLTISLIWTKPAYAQMDIEVSTPAIRSLKESLKGRFPKLKPYYDEGRIGESKAGAIEVRNLDGLGLKDKSTLLKLLEDENKDRQELYKEILNANKLGPEHMSEVERIFANSWRKDAHKGWWIQNDDSKWVQKE